MEKSEKGEGMFPLTSEARETFPSLLPVRTSHKGVRDCKINVGMLRFLLIFPSTTACMQPRLVSYIHIYIDGEVLTGKETASRAAKARISAQETTPGQACSSLDFISLISS